MPNLGRGCGRSVVVLATLTLVYLLWPYLIGALALIGAIQLYLVWGRRRGP